MLHLIDKLYNGENLSIQEAKNLILSFLSEDADPLLITAALVALKIKGESPDEITGAAKAMIEKARVFQVDNLETLDTCGTGGDGHETVNISTASAIIAAEAGCAVVKHGNRSVSSKSGSADILEQLGLPLVLPPSIQSRCLHEAGICFLFAPNYHPAVKAVMPVRRTLKTRTLFNILGPLVNPARPSYQILGVFKKELCRPMAETLLKLGVKKAIVVYGSGLDEFTLHAPTQGVLVREGKLEACHFTPEKLGLQSAPLEAIKGGTPEENAAWLKSLLQGHGTDTHKDAVAYNAGAAIWIANRAQNLDEGIEISKQILNSGRGWNRFQKWLEVARGA